MKLAIVGTRTFNNYEQFYDALHYRYNHIINDWPIFMIDLIISGGATGADALAKRFAIENKIPYEEFLPDWKKHGKMAGPIRNGQIAEAADEVIAFWDLKSRGTKSTINQALMAGKPVTIIPIKEPT